MSTWNYHNIVNQLYSNIIQKALKKKKKGDGEETTEYSRKKTSDPGDKKKRERQMKRQKYVKAEKENEAWK